MKGLQIALVILLLSLASCREESATVIVQKSLNFHGGLNAWQAVESLSYQKEEWLYLENDSLESYTKRTYTHPLTQDLPITIEWIEDSLQHSIKRDSNGFSANFPVNAKEADNYNNTLLTAPYTLCQPYKLLNDADLLERLPDELLEDTPVYTVGVAYTNEDGSPGNSWRYYFNKKNYRLEGALVKHGSTYAYVRNLEFETTTGLSLNAKRISYRVDSLRNIQYVRGRYAYTYQQP